MIVGLGAGLLWFFRGLRIYRKYRVLADTPKTPIRSIPMGFVEVHGKAKPAEGGLVNSPVTLTPCLFYKVVIESGDKAVGHFRTVTEGVPFLLEDGTGHVLVDAHGADFDLIRTSWREVGAITLRGIFEAFRDVHAPPKMLVEDNQLMNWAESFRSGVSSCRHYRFAEYCLLPGHWYDVTGTCVENPEPKDEHDRNVIVKGLDQPTLLITWRSEAEIKQTLRSRAAKHVFGGGGLAVACLGFLLSKAGWL